MRLRDVFVGSSEKAGLAGAAQTLARPLTRRLKGRRRGEPRQADLVRAVKESGLFDLGLVREALPRRGRRGDRSGGALRGPRRPRGALAAPAVPR
ncbi:hypothetical protein ACU4GR_32000 [Methylobacterium oryzae CBMB20]